MSDLERYLDFAQAHPEKFVNPPGAIFTILLDRETIHEAEAVVERKLLGHGATPEQAHEWSRVGIAFQDQYSFLLRDAVRFPDGSLGTYGRIVDPEESVHGVIVLPVYQGQVVLISHFRHATRTWFLEIPRGFGEPGATGEENARRELAEEIGATVVRLVSLGCTYPDAGASAECNDLFYAELATYGRVDSTEAIADLRLITVSEFERLIRENEITDGYTLTAYARAKAQAIL